MDIRIPADIRKFKTKDIGNFSFKEAAFIVAGIGAMGITYYFTKSLEICFAPGIPILIFGFFKPHGMSCWQFLRTVGKDKLTPQIYINQTDFEYEPEKFEEIYGEPIQLSPAWSNQDNAVNKQSKEEAKLFMR